MKHLIFDVNVIVDYWLGELSAASTAELLDSAQTAEVRRWVVASSLPTLAYVARTAFKSRGLPPEAVAQQVVPQLMQELLREVGVLTNHGFEQSDIYQKAHDFEDAQIAAAARSLAGQEVCVVTEDKRFDTLGEVQALPPALALAWLHQPPAVSTAQAPLQFIDLASQQAQLRPQLERNIHRVLRHGQYIMGPEVRELEQKLAAYSGAKHCITCASGTEALLMSLMALGIGPGDEVITTPFTFAATAEMIVLAGAKPIFVDIERGTCLLDASKIEERITPRTKAIMPVSLYGQVCDMDAINAIAARHGNIPVIEDAAQSFGASYSGQSGVKRKSCNLSTIGCTSFFPSKPLGCYGDGGAIFTNDDALAKAMREIRVHGQERRYYHTRIGVGGRMDALQCAVVLAKLERFDWEVERRLALGEQYREMLVKSGLPVTLITVHPDRDCVWAQFTVVVENRAELQKHLQEQGVPTAVHYPLSLNRQPAYKDDASAIETVNSHWAGERVMSLPFSPDLDRVTQQRVITALQFVSESVS